MNLPSKLTVAQARVQRLLGLVFHGRRGWILGAALLFVYSMYTGLTSGRIGNDEAWYLQVMRRLADGETLYKDVFFNVTPLSAYLAAPLVRIFGAELLVIKVLMAGCFAATGLLMLGILHRLGLSARARALALLAYLAYTPSWLPAAGAPYTPLAYVLILAVFLTLLSWHLEDAGGETPARTDRRRAMTLGVLCGLTFATKQNLGGYLLLGTLLVMLFGIGMRRTRTRNLLTTISLIAAGFTAASLITILPILLTGGFERLLEYGFLNRANYVRAASISYVSQLSRLGGMIRNLNSWSNLLQAYWQTQYLFPFAAVGSLFIAWPQMSSAKHRISALVVVFFGIAFTGVFPRVDFAHILPALPMTLVALAWGASHIHFRPEIRWARVVYTLCTIWLSLGVIALIARPIRWMVRASHQWSTLPHFRSQLLPKSEIERYQVGSAFLKDHIGDEHVFFLAPSASTYYLLTESGNPTPYDYPLLTAFGFDGQSQVVGELRKGEITWVCLSPLGRHPLSPRLLESYVQKNLTRIEETSFCTLFRVQADRTD